MNENRTPQSMEEVLHPGADTENHDPAFPHAPRDWRRASAVKAAQAEGLDLTEDHWEAVRALQAYYARKEKQRVNTRELHDALDEKFHARGGIKFLYTLFPGGPIAQGCRLAGLEAPAGAVDAGFGSVV
jgi:tRNA 2-thiouridine synthesizing protein E